MKSLFDLTIKSNDFVYYLGEEIADMGSDVFSQFYPHDEENEIYYEHQVSDLFEEIEPDLRVWVGDITTGQVLDLIRKRIPAPEGEDISAWYAAWQDIVVGAIGRSCGEDMFNLPDEEVEEMVDEYWEDSN